MVLRTEANLVCPLCYKSQKVIMPIDACVYFFKCQHCGQTFKPKKGDDCVFCSYADVKCPDQQISAE